MRLRRGRFTKSSATEPRISSDSAVVRLKFGGNDANSDRSVIAAISEQMVEIISSAPASYYPKRYSQSGVQRLACDHQLLTCLKNILTQRRERTAASLLTALLGAVFVGIFTRRPVTCFNVGRE